MKNFFNRMKYSFERFMQGRYGFDELNKILVIFGIGLYIVILIIPKLRFLSVFAVAAIAWAFMRMMSTNSYKRQSERQAYIKILNKLNGRKNYRYFKCEKCKAPLKVPVGKGKIRVTCPKCSHQMIKKT